MKPKNDYKICLMAFLAIVSVAYYLCSYWQPTSLSNLISSDTLYAPAIVNDLIYGHGRLSDWLFPQMPAFFPDMLVSFIIGLFSSNAITQMIVFWLIQLLWLVIIVSLLLRLITHRSLNIYVGILFTLTILLFSNEWSTPMRLELLGAMFFSAYHFSAFLMTLTGLYLFIQICNSQRNSLAWLFYVLITISIASELVIGFYFTIPLLVTVLLCGLLKLISPKPCLKLAALLLVTTVSGYLIYKYCPLYYLRDSHFFHYQSGNLQAFLKIIVNFMHQSPITALLWLSFLLLAPISLMKNRNADWTNFVILWLLIMTVLMIPVFILVDHNLRFIKIGYMGLRHLQPLILIPIFIGIPLLICKHTQLCELLQKKSIYILGFTLIILISLNRPIIKISQLSTFSPQGVACLDHYAESLQLHAGVGEYWTARLFTLYNHSGIKILPISDDFSPRIWLNSQQDFKENNQYDFIVMKSSVFSFDQQRVLARFGKPTATFTCPESYEFYVYQNNAMKNIFSKPIVVPSWFKPRWRRR